NYLAMLNAPAGPTNPPSLDPEQPPPRHASPRPHTALTMQSVGTFVSMQSVGTVRKHARAAGRDA
ncbi:MAG: hypothetical protein ACPIOQ_84355, partial [Promethearchaeia archaeon]